MPLLESRSKAIENVTYTVTQLGSKKGLEVLLVLTKAVAPAMGTPGNGPARLAGVLSSLKADDLSFVCDAFAASTTIRMARGELDLGPQFDLHFAGKYAALFQWLAFAVEVNFADFFQRGRELFKEFISRAEKLADPKSSSPKDATPGSGESLSPPA